MIRRERLAVHARGEERATRLQFGKTQHPAGPRLRSPRGLQRIVEARDQHRRGGGRPARGLEDPGQRHTVPLDRAHQAEVAGIAVAGALDEVRTLRDGATVELGRHEAAPGERGATGPGDRPRRRLVRESGRCGGAHEHLARRRHHPIRLQHPEVGEESRVKPRGAEHLSERGLLGTRAVEGEGADQLALGQRLARRLHEPVRPGVCCHQPQAGRARRAAQEIAARRPRLGVEGRYGAHGQVFHTRPL